MKATRGRMAQRAHDHGRAAGRAWAAAACTWSLVACDIPTDAPKLETRFLLPAEAMSVTVADLLPASVEQVGTSFRMHLAGATLSTLQLSQTCGALCGATEALTLPKPQLRDSAALPLVLPRDVLGATLSGGALEIALAHGLNFDLLRPTGASETGIIEVTARSAGRVVGTVRIQEPFPGGTSLRRTLPLQPGEVSGEVIISVVVQSPAGDPVPAEWLRTTGPALTATILAQPVAASAAQIRIENKPVALDQVSLDLSRIDASVAGRVRGGAVLLTIDDPFGVTGTLELRLTGNGLDLTRPVRLESSRRTSRVEFTYEETRLMLGQKLTLSLAGVVNAQGGQTAVRPGQTITIGTSFELLLEL